MKLENILITAGVITGAYLLYRNREKLFGPTLAVQPKIVYINQGQTDNEKPLTQEDKMRLVSYCRKKHPFGFRGYQECVKAREGLREGSNNQQQAQDAILS